MIELKWLINSFAQINDKNNFFRSDFDKLSGTSYLRKQIIEGLSESEIRYSWKEGLEKFKKQIYDMCILDVMMPFKDGFTLAEEIRQIDNQIPLIFLTAKSLKDDMIRGFKIGADDYLVKPFDSEVLLLKIKSIFRTKFNSKTFLVIAFCITFDTIRRASISLQQKVLNDLIFFTTSVYSKCIL